jgi:hypothetical protein
MSHVVLGFTADAERRMDTITRSRQEQGWSENNTRRIRGKNTENSTFS